MCLFVGLKSLGSPALEVDFKCDLIPFRLSCTVYMSKFTAEIDMSTELVSIANFLFCDYLFNCPASVALNFFACIFVV